MLFQYPLQQRCLYWRWCVVFFTLHAHDVKFPQIQHIHVRSRAHMKLTIKLLQTGDFGNYRCISKNSLGETEGSIRVYGKWCRYLKVCGHSSWSNQFNIICTVNAIGKPVPSEVKARPVAHELYISNTFAIFPWCMWRVLRQSCIIKVSIHSKRV